MFGNMYYDIKICLFDINMWSAVLTAYSLTAVLDYRYILAYDYTWMRPLFEQNE